MFKLLLSIMTSFPSHKIVDVLVINTVQLKNSTRERNIEKHVKGMSSIMKYE